MLNEKEAQSLSERLERLTCTNPSAANGLFTFVLMEEPSGRAPAYEEHMAECEYCRTALQLYRYKRDSVKVFNNWEAARKIVSSARDPDSSVLIKQLKEKTAYFAPGTDGKSGTTVIVNSSGEFLSVTNQTNDEFVRLDE